MAEYYPLLAKAVGSLPNSTPDTRRVVYERARKALIGQLRTYHPPVPEEDIERESLELDRAVERLETELAAAPPAPAPPPVVAAGDAKPAEPAVAKPPAAAPRPQLARPSLGAPGVAAPRKPLPPLRPRAPKPAVSEAAAKGADATSANDPSVGEAKRDPIEAAADVPPPAGELKLPTAKPEAAAPPPPAPGDEPSDTSGRPRLEAQRPFAPQPPIAKGPKRRIWIIPAGIAVVVALVAGAAWKLRVTPEQIAKTTPVAQTAQDNGKIADRVGGAKPEESTQAPEPPSAPTPQEAQQQQPAPAPQTGQQGAQDTPKTNAPAPAGGNPELPVAYRAALLVEAPDLPSKVQTFAGTVVWKLNNVNGGPGDAVGLSVEADVDLPDDKMKATIVFEKNTDPSLPASHTIKVRFNIGPGSYSGDVKQINVPQMRREGNSDGEPLAGVTVPVVQNSFLVGLSPGNAESANLRLLSELPWVDIPILLTNGKIAKLTFEKGAAGQRDIAEAVAAWQKQ